MKAYKPDDRRIAEHAAQWQQALAGGDARVRSAFTDWLLESRRHVRNFLLLTAFDRELRHIDPQRRFDVDALLAGADGNVIALENEAVAARRPPAWRRYAVAALAASIAVAGSASLWFFGPWSGADTYATTIGEQQTLKLEDGSVVHLNAQSRLQVAYSTQRREIHLLSGEALFVVERDAARPFTVTAGAAVVQAVGTQFNIKRNANDTLVCVVEGRVRIDGEASLLDAGQEVRIDDKGHRELRSAANVERRVAWRQRLLEFRDDPLADVVAEFNRYNRAPHFRVQDPAAARSYTGVFKADDPQSLAQLLSQEKDLELERSGEEILIRTRLAND